MIKKTHLLATTLIALAILTFWQPPTAHACSGLPIRRTMTELIETSDLIVDGVPVEIDDAQQNGIIYVERYLKGQGPRHLLIYQTDPMYTASQIAYPPDTCYWLSPPLRTGLSYTFVLRRNDNGGYSVIEAFAFFAEDQQHYAYVWETQSDGSREKVELIYDRKQLTTNLNKLADDHIYFPTDDFDIPRKHPLLITTDSGKTYIFPVDNGDIVEFDPTPPYDRMYVPADLDEVCDTNSCLVYSPDNANAAIVTNDDRILMFQPYQTNEGLGNFEGQAISYSPRSDRAVIWHDNSLTVVSPQSYNVYEDLTVELTPSEGVDFTGNGVWTADNFFLYTDADGIWLWELYRTNTRQLLIPAGDAPLLIDAVDDPLLIYRTTADTDKPVTVFHMDREYSLSVATNYTVRADVPIVLHWQDEPNEDGRRSIDYCWMGRWGAWTQDACGQAIIDLAPEVIIKHVDLISTYEFAVIACESSPDACVITFRDFSYELENHILFEYIENYTRDFVHNPATDETVILWDDYTFELDDEIFDVSDVLDSPIATIKWMPSLFYEQH